MALSEFELKKCEKVVGVFVEKRRPPLHVRKQLDLGFRIKGQSVEIFEIRPLWNDPKKKIEEAVAKTTYVKNSKEWNVYWQRADLKWHRYDPNPSVKSLEEFLDLVAKDEYACFFG
jgi:spore coat polysaccharide biosynthesis protein SpsF (cytidylyltransferase family)